MYPMKTKRSKASLVEFNVFGRFNVFWTSYRWTIFSHIYMYNVKTLKLSKTLIATKSYQKCQNVNPGGDRIVPPKWGSF